MLTPKDLRKQVALPTPVRSVFGDWLVLREVAPAGGRRLDLHVMLTEDVTRAMRGALLHYADDPPPATFSGHAPDGHPLDQPHVAFLALPDEGSHNSSATLLGAAIVLPRDVDPADRRAVLRAAGRWERNGLRLILGRTAGDADSGCPGRGRKLAGASERCRRELLRGVWRKQRGQEEAECPR